jgi:hypothetical protein
LNAAPEQLRLLRLQRSGTVNHVKELSKESTRAIAADPLMKYSNVLSGIFYQRVVIAESDSDCLFYSAILDLPSVHGSLQPDVLFIHASGKHRMAGLTKALRAFDVSVDIIADIDVLRESESFKQIVVALGGDWESINAHATPLRSAIEQHKPWLNSAEVKKGVSEVVATAPEAGEFPRKLRGEIDAIFRKASPWDAVKDAGEAAIPSGQPTLHYNELRRLCQAVGLWVVPVGELEGFCKSIGGHGPRWVQQVVENKNLAEDSELAPARDFVRDLWERIS